jgi:exopolysaccharide/PEP-CTERM locus tyrosine autokinase
VITGGEHEEFTQAFKILRTQIVHAMRDNNWNAIAITSPGDSDGKTVTAINLAIHLAAEVDRTVLLVDANLRQPELHTYFGLTAEQGLSDFLVDQVALEKVLIHPGIERLVLLPGGKPLPNSAEMLGSPMMQDLVAELKKRYPQRIVLFDLPPVLTASDALAFAPYVDATILVAAQGHTTHQDIERAAELLGSTTNLLGIVLNKTKPDDSRVADRVPFWRRWFSRSAA